MRILFYTYSLQIGGAETVCVEYLLQLKKRGFEVCLVEDFHTTDSFLARKLQEGGVPVIPLWKGSVTAPFGMQRKRAARLLGLSHSFNRLLGTFQPDIVHLHGLPDHVDRLDFPAERMMFTFHSRVERNLEMLGEANTRLLKKLCIRGMYLCALTQEDRQEAQMRLQTDRVLCIPNGLDLGKVREIRYDREELRKRLGIPKEGFLVGTLGRLHEVKNHERLLAIFGKVKEKRPDALLLIVGGDAEGRMEKLKAQAVQYGFGEAVFFPGIRSDADAILAALDCFVLPSKSESFGLAAVEAQAQGVRCVVSRAVPEDVLCTRQAVSVSLEEPNEVWAEAILNGDIENPAPKDLTRFDMETVIPELIKEYEGLLHGT